MKEGDFSVHSCYWKRQLSLLLRYNTKGYCCGQRTNWSLQSVAVALAQVVGFFLTVSDHLVYMSFSVNVISYLLQVCLLKWLAEAQFIVPDWGDKVYYGKGL